VLFFLLIIVSYLAVVKAVQAIVLQQKEHEKIDKDWERTKEELDRIEEERRFKENENL